MSVESLTPRVREALGVSQSYDTESIPNAIRRAIKRLLRDYNFPKSVQTVVWDTVELDPDAPGYWPVGRSFVQLPAGFKKDLLIHYVVPGNDPPKTRTWTEGLKKVEGFRMPNDGGDAYSRWYWLSGNFLFIDKPFYEAPTDYTQLQLYYQSWNVKENEEWFTEDFEDVLFTFTVYRTAAEMRKPEVMKAYQGLWMEDVQSLAIYTNELEFDNLYMMMKEPTYSRSERYPI